MFAAVQPMKSAERITAVLEEKKDHPSSPIRREKAKKKLTALLNEVEVEYESKSGN